MNKYIFLIINILCIQYLNSQVEFPNIPTKENKIYYNLSSSFQNKKKCLNEYIKDVDKLMNEKIKEKIKGRYEKKYDNDNLVGVGFTDSKRNKKNVSCVDTIESGNFTFTLPNSFNYFDFTLIGGVKNIIKPKVILSVISSEPMLVFTSKNSVELRLRKFKMEQHFIDGSQNSIDLSEYYLKLKEKEKISKKDINLFIELDEIIKITNQSFQESFRFNYENEEQD
jgi:hypothetical protein